MGVVKPFTRDQELFALAKHIHSEIQRELKVVDVGLTRATELLGQMRRQRLWKVLGFRSFEGYIRKAHPKLANSRSTLYNLLAIDDLTTGDNPIPKEVVRQMGLKKAVEMSRLEPFQRTPEVIEIALKQPLSKVRNCVQAELNKELPRDEQKPMTQMFTLLLPEDTLDELNVLLDDMQYAEGVRDGDTTRSLRAKAMDAIVKGARQFYEQELAEAAEYRAALEGMESSPAADAQEQLDR